jgi:hypothetical protein
MVFSRLQLAIIGGLAALFLAVAVVQSIRLDGFLFWDGALDKLADCREARAKDRQTYEDAQKAAAAKNRAEVHRITTEQQRKTDAAKSQYERDLARLRAGGVRPEYTAPPGSPGKPGTGPNAEATCRADAENVCVPRSVIVQAAEIELGRNALIDWVEQQLKIAR